jgi:hypothetical protein
MSFMASEADVLAAVADYQAARSCCTGGDIHFHTANHGSHAFLWETHRSFQPEYASARIEAVRVFPSLLALLERPVCLSGHVTDALTGEAVAATITYLDVVFENDETNGSDERWGRYHAFMPSGTYFIEFDAGGYFPQYHTVEVDSGLSQVVDVAMVPSAGDINEDNRVDMADFAAFALCWLQHGSDRCRSSDLTKDQNVDFNDLKILTENWLSSQESMPGLFESSQGR